MDPNPSQLELSAKNTGRVFFFYGLTVQSGLHAHVYSRTAGLSNRTIVSNKNDVLILDRMYTSADGCCTVLSSLD